MQSDYARHYGTDDLALPGGVDGAAPHRNLILEAHQRLRGRYLWAILASAALAPILAAAGWLATRPEFKSSGIVRVAPTLPRLLYESEDNKLPPLFDSYVAAQATYLQSARVIDRALDPSFKVAQLGDRSLIEAGWPTGPEGKVRLLRRLSVDLRRGSQLITVSVADPQPAMAQNAVNAVLAAYETLYGEAGEIATTQRERILQDRKQRLDRDLKIVVEKIWNITEKQGPDTIDRLHSARIDELQRIDSERMAVETALIQSQSRASTKGESEAESVQDASEDRRARELARIDPPLANLLQERELANLDIERLSATFGPAHRDIVRRRSDLQIIDQQIAARIRTLEESGADPAALAATGNLADLPPAQLTSMLEQYNQVRARIAADAEALSAKRQEIAKARDQETEIRRLLDETSVALETVQVEKESAGDGRISVAQYGDMPLAPSTDRRIPLALAGAAAGVGAGVGAFLLIGALDRRFRYSDDVLGRDVGPTRLGVLPELSSTEEEQQEQARVGVHQIRNLLASTVRAKDGGRVLCITSAMPGDGKTSLVMALGLSFASGGDRTLVIDADLVGRGLTRTLSLTNRPGLRDLLEQRRSLEDTLSSCFPGLHAIPSGSTSDFAPEHMSPSKFTRLINQLRSRFDTILIDTGPLLGSIEADLAAAASDSTVLVVARGQSYSAAQECFRRLREVRRPCAGYVFNRASASDFRRSSSNFSTSRAALPAQRTTRQDQSDLMNALLSNMRLGRLLCRMGRLTEEQLANALRIQEETGAPLGEVLISQGFVTADDLATALQSQRHRGTADDDIQPAA